MFCNMPGILRGVCDRYRSPSVLGYIQYILLGVKILHRPRLVTAAVMLTSGFIGLSVVIVDATGWFALSPFF